MWCRHQWPYLLWKWSKITINQWMHIWISARTLHIVTNVIPYHCEFMQICNNYGQCSCNAGFVGSVCQWLHNKHPRQKRELLQNQPCIGIEPICIQGTENCPIQIDCLSGYILEGSSCVDINECEIDTHNCEQLCMNTDGSFRCTCISGYRLSSDGRTCSQNGRMIQNEESYTLFKFAINFKIFLISMSVLSTMVAVINCVPTQWDHSIVTAEVVIDFQVMEEHALVGSKHNIR